MVVQPLYHGAPSDTDWALVIEGGGMRGAYIGGVVGTLTLNKIPPERFRWIFGVSAGASSAAYYIAKQVGYGFRVWKRLFVGRQFVRNLGNVFLGRQVLDLAYLEHVFRELVPLDVERIMEYPGEFRIVVTNCETGKPEYIVPTAELCILLLKITAAFPPFHAPFRFHETLYADGAMSDPIPVQAAIDAGAKNILVISTTPREHRARKHWGTTPLSWMAFPFNRTMRRVYQGQHRVYNAAKDMLIIPTPGVRIITIQPEKTLPVWELDTDARHLTATMTQGELDTMRVIEAHNLKRLLGQT